MKIMYKSEYEAGDTVAYPKKQKNDASTLSYDEQMSLIKNAIAKKNHVTYEDSDDGKILVTVIDERNTTCFPIDELATDIKKEIDTLNAIKRKKRAKDEAKSLSKIKYKIGDCLILRGKIKDGSERIVKKFEVKKVIWSIHSNPVNILILRQFEGPNNNRSIDKNDCKKYHIKYEPGLQVYSMMLNFSKIKRK